LREEVGAATNNVVDYPEWILGLKYFCFLDFQTVVFWFSKILF